jgi:hypothetical protein
MVIQRKKILLTRVERIEADPKFSQAREELRLDVPENSVVYALIDARHNIAILFTNGYNLCYLPPKVQSLSDIVDEKQRVDAYD